jgi:hypothetical protein
MRTYHKMAIFWGSKDAHIARIDGGFLDHQHAELEPQKVKPLTAPTVEASIVNTKLVRKGVNVHSFMYFWRYVQKSITIPPQPKGLS